MDKNKYATSSKKAAPTPSGIKGKARDLLRNAVLTTLALTQRSLADRFLRCLYCHYVFDDQKSQFENLILELKKLGTFVNTDTCLNMLTGKVEIDNRYFHLSFDDGFRNIFTNALPILKKHYVPAIVFVPSSLVGADWERTKMFCLNITRYAGIIETIKWHDLKEIVSSGYEVGSHTKNHARFSTISQEPALLEDEILGSKNAIENNLGIECKYISWPYGKLTDADELSLEMVEKAGYRACFGAFRGSVLPMTTSNYSIPRHHFEVQWPLSHIKYFARGNYENYHSHNR